MPGKIPIPPAATSDEVADAFPSLSRFAERCDRDSASEFFRETKTKLESLTGWRTAPAKKALAAIERVESLLLELYEIRLQLEKAARRGKTRHR